MASSNKKPPVFPVSQKGKAELKRVLVRSTDPEHAISSYQQSHSLHTMLAKAFDTSPRYQEPAQRSVKEKEQQPTNSDNAEPLDTDSVLTFLSHLGVSQYEIHKKISDALLKQLEDEIRKSASTNTLNNDGLLNLLKSCWSYATTIPELRPVLWAVLKQLGDQTPPAVLDALAERDSNNSLKHAEVLNPLTPHLKRLVWERDWDKAMETVPANADDMEPAKYLELAFATLLGKLFQPIVEAYCGNDELVEAANRPFVSSVRERRILTTQRRALTATSTATLATSTSKSSATTSALTSLSANSTTTTLAPTSASSSVALLTTGKAISRIRQLLGDAVGGTTLLRPKLLLAVVSMLMARHAATSYGEQQKRNQLLAGPAQLHCTLLADILLSAGGPLPKAYQHVVGLARTLDDCVKNGVIADTDLIKLQEHLRLVLEVDETSDKVAVPSVQPAANKTTDSDTSALLPEGVTTTTFMKRQLNRIVAAGLAAMKEADPQNLFLNPVTDDIAPGYSKVINRPMCLRTMEEKLQKNAYGVLLDWELDVKLMFDNCVRYNRGAAGQWFRGEAKRQHQVFKEEILPQAKKLYQAELAKRTRGDETNNNNSAAAGTSGAAINDKKRPPEGDAPTAAKIRPLPGATSSIANKKHKKDNLDQSTPNMPALAYMLLADPFVVRLLLDRLLRALRQDVMRGSSIPAAHAIVPSLLQLLHIAQWSSQMCGGAPNRSQSYLVPDAGFLPISLTDKNILPVATLPYDSLRRFVPLFLRLILEAEVDRRMAAGGDLHAAAPMLLTRTKTSSLVVSKESWTMRQSSPVLLSMLEGALVNVCLPGNATDTSLSLTFPKFAVALQQISSSMSLLQELPFFLGLNQSILRHKSKLSRGTRDVLVSCWLEWLRSNKNSICSAAHECLIRLLNEWAALGNLLLPRDMLVKFCTDAIEAVNSSASLYGQEAESFRALWNKKTQDGGEMGKFGPIQKQYERMIQSLPQVIARQWKLDIGILDDSTANTTVDEIAAIDEGEGSDPG